MNKLNLNLERELLTFHNRRVHPVGIYRKVRAKKGSVVLILYDFRTIWGGGGRENLSQLVRDDEFGIDL
jgi:hypothetical protein